MPLAGEVVVDLRGLDSIGAVDATAAQVTAGAGVTLAALQAHLRPHGLAFGVDLAARDTATIGGMVATNAGGLHVVRHGSMRAQVLGVQAVLGTGALVEANLAGLVKDNTGYDLAGLLCGSEGTLGIVTAVRLRLVPIPAGRLVALLGLDVRRRGGGERCRSLRALPSLQAVELVLDVGLEVVGRAPRGAPRRSRAPVRCSWRWPASLLPLADQLAVALERLGDAVVSSAVADDPTGVERLWRWREAHAEAAATLGLVHKADVTLPIAELATFVDRVVPVVEDAAPGSTTLVYGHLADGNLHVNVVGPPADDDRAVRRGPRPRARAGWQRER